ncbi:transcription regulator [Companilactobacillus tucceti DSM 20183]|uniref:Transcription regulator n=1 Tax=Companilactobacillus tucceti DSM 20183 TaxID=1423811 RepID=A0A0R1IZR8_9LACO|nr:GntR family transcriptional regulator [Companilactobacillus tucceti]KRK64504.1 transcription regulator [Companilactobacillus tucceti DSM 20183]
MERIILYQQVADDLKRKILSGEYDVGDFLPTETELEKIYDVSKITVRNAIKVLVSEGYVEKQSGKGTTVISNRLFNRLSKAQSFSSILEHEGSELQKEILSVDEISADESPVKFDLNRLTGSITRITKIYRLNGRPYILLHHYLPFKLNDEMKYELEKVSLYQVIKEIGEMVNNFDDEFFAYKLNSDEQKQLESSEDIGIRRIRKSFNHHGHLIEYSEAIYLTSLNPYKIKYEI